MRSGWKAGVRIALCLLGGLAEARAAVPVTWEFPAKQGPSSDGGVSEGIAVGEDGSLRLSATLREVFPGGSKLASPPFVWSLATDLSGNLFFGTGNDGEVFSLDRKGTPSSLLDTRELGVRALASVVSGDLFAATFPTGGVYRIGADGKVDPWFEPEERYLWALTADRSGHLYVGTGERGVVYRVLGAGQGGTLFDSEESHVTSLAFTAAGDLLAGTSPSGLLYRIGPDGQATLLFDSDLREIAAIAAAPDGTAYVAAIGDEAPPPPRRPGERSDFLIEVTPSAEAGVMEEPTELPRKITIDLADLLPAAPGGESGIAGRIYRIAPGRAPTLLWRSDTERVYALAWTRERGLIFGTGGGATGALYSLSEEGAALLLQRMREPQVTAVAALADGRVYAGTSFPGRVYLVEPGTASGGTHTSAVLDASGTTRWGTIAWDAETPEGTLVEVATRSGNRPSPDGSWSDWSATYPYASGATIVSPPARYLQWRATLGRARTDRSPTLRSVRITHLPPNLAPSVRGVKVLLPGQKAPAPANEPPAPPGGPDSTAAPAPAEPPKGHRWIAWTTEDPDKDASRHTLWLQRADGSEPRRLAESVASSPWPLEDASLSEGIYTVRVEATDAGVNGPERGLSASAQSAPFLVDHTPPKLSLRPLSTSVPGAIATEIVAADGPGRIERAEFSRAGDASPAAWTSLPCRDGICDTGTESFLVPAADGSASQKLTVRVFDAAGNSATIETSDSSRKGDRAER